uniref:Uncharacterized protein n=1 Tax=Arundo donax TaxID=35708 RepID=A0A0A9FWJ3_ARUDO
MSVAIVITEFSQHPYQA